MKLIGPIGKLQDLNLRNGDFVVCVKDAGYNSFTAGDIYKWTGAGIENINGGIDRQSISTFQRLHHHDPRCFGFEDKTRSGEGVEIFKVQDDGKIIGSMGGEDHDDWQADGTWWEGSTSVIHDLIPLTPQTEFEVLGHRFPTRKAAEDAMEIKEVTL